MSIWGLISSYVGEPFKAMFGGDGRELTLCHHEGPNNYSIYVYYSINISDSEYYNVLRYAFPFLKDELPNIISDIRSSKKHGHKVYTSTIEHIEFRVSQIKDAQIFCKELFPYKVKKHE